MTISLQNAIDRLVELEIAAMAAFTTPVTGDAVDHFTHTQNNFPYWTNRPGRITLPDDEEDLDYPTYIVISRLVIGHVGEGYDGDLENSLQLWIPQLITYFNARPTLVTATQSSGLPNLLHARVSGATGLAILQNYGSIGSQVGCEFTHTLEFVEEIELQLS